MAKGSFVVLDALLLVLVQLFAALVQGSAYLRQKVLRLIDGVHQVAAESVLRGVLLRIANRLLNFILAHFVVGGDGDGLGASSVLVARGDGQDAVGVNIERDLNFRHACHCAADALQTELADALVVPRHRALTLQDVDFY